MFFPVSTLDIQDVFWSLSSKGWRCWIWMGRQLSTKRAASSHECRRDVRIEHTVHTGSNIYCVCQPSDIKRYFSVLVKIEGLENHAGCGVATFLKHRRAGRKSLSLRIRCAQVPAVGTTERWWQWPSVLRSNNFKWVYPTTYGIHVMLYMVTYIASIYPSHVSIYTIHGSYGL